MKLVGKCEALGPALRIEARTDDGDLPSLGSVGHSVTRAFHLSGDRHGSLPGTVATMAALSSIMLIQIVHCHPLVESYNHALFRTIVETLKQNGHEVVATDLYR